MTGLCAALVLAAASAGAGAPEPPAPGVERRMVGNLEVTTAILPGAALALAMPRQKDGSRHLVALVREQPPGTPPSGSDDDRNGVAWKGPPGELPPPALVLVDAAAARLETIVTSLPDDTRFLDTGDWNGDGREDVFAFTDGSWLVALAGADDSWSGVDEAAATGTSWRHGLARDLWIPDRRPDDPLWLTLPGRLLTYGPGPSGAWKLRSEVTLPVLPSAGRERIQVSSPGVHLVGRSREGRLVLATHPRTEGPERLRVWLIDPLADEEARVAECWLRLPDREMILDADLLMIDGRPALAVTSRPSEHLGLFAEKLLRVWMLAEGRAQRRPVLVAKSRANIWQEVRFFARDVDADGRDDLILAYWKGMKLDRVVLDAYLGNGNGFAGTPRTTALDVKKASPSMILWEDLDGDALPELVVRSAAALRIHRGLPGKRGRDLVARKPDWSLPLEGSLAGGASVTLGPGGVRSQTTSAWFTRPAAVDLDADGRRELIVPGYPSRLVVASIRPERAEPD